MAGEPDSKKQRKQLFAQKREPHLVDVPEFRKLAMVGEETSEVTAYAVRLNRATAPHR